MTEDQQSPGPGSDGADLAQELTRTLPPDGLPCASPPSTKDERFAPGATIAGRYRIVSLLGRGGMGEVYRAQDLRLGEAVALKFLPPEVTGQPDRIQGLLAEVRLGRKVSHPNVCRIHDLVETEGRTFLSMELVDGEDLTSLLRRIESLPAKKVLELTRDIAAGLAAIHRRGIVHRDLKPGNVMIDGKGQARITDFGVAGLASDLEDHRELAGTLAYMAPEQLSRGESSERSDLYALGLVVYEMLIGERPFVAETTDELLTLQRTTRPPLCSLAPGLEPEVEALVLRCLDPDPARRPASALEVIEALPGGDALAAAVAAGETPSPQLVAAAGPDGELSLARGAILVASVLVGLIAIAPLSERTMLHHQVGVPKPPAVLAERAHDLLALAGAGGPFRDEASSFFTTEIAAMRQHASGQALADHQPPPLRFFLRSSPDILRPREALFTRLYHPAYTTLGRVGLDDPPLAEPGEAVVIIDPEGRLVELRVVPVQRDSPAESIADPWPELLAATGINPATLEAVTPERVPPVATDRRFAWRATFLDGDPVRLEAGDYDGRPVWLETLGPWMTEGPPLTTTASSLKAATTSAIVFILLIVFLVPLLVARNLRLGRADRDGAIRLTLFCFTTYLLAGLARIDHLPIPRAELLLFGTLLAHATFVGILAAGVYLAMEPFVRRRWPQTLIGWSRLISGRLGDPLVGRDLLVGLLAGLVVWILFPLAELLEQALGNDAAGSLVIAPSTLSSLLDVTYYLLYSTYPAILNGLSFLFILVLLRAVLRRTDAAFLALWVALALPLAAGGGGTWPGLAGGLLGAGVLAWVLARYGLLSITAALYVFFLFVDLPFTSDPSSWYFGRSTLVLGLLAVLALWAFMVSIGRRRLSLGELFD